MLLISITKGVLRMKANNKNLIRSVYAALCLALAMVLPLLTGQIQVIGKMLCPMHLPVLLCGFICGWPWGLAVGFISPLLRFAIFGMPPIMPDGIPMAFELAVYGLVSGLLYRKFKKSTANVYLTLLISMLAGRIASCFVKMAVAGVSGNVFSFSAFFAGVVTKAVPGIILQLVFIPAIIIALDKANLIP